MAQDSDLERTEPATAKRLSTARENGEIPRSHELTTFAITITSVALLILLGDRLTHFLGDITRRLLTFDAQKVQDTEFMLLSLKGAMTSTLWQLAPFFGVLVIVALLAPLLVGGWNVTFKPLLPKFSKINPLMGIKRVFSLNAVTEGGKAMLKSLLIGGMATGYIWNKRTEIIGLITMPLDVGMAHMLQLTLTTFWVVVLAMALLVALDIPYQLWSFHKKLRMTKEEVKQEYKESEGVPEVRSRIRQMQREAVRKRMMREVPTASVIVTNPTHYAVALKYETGMAAPKVVAKGAMRLAEKIIELGKAHHVIVMRSARFARALYFHAEIGEEIPTKLYSAAAQVLAYVFQLQLYGEQGGVAPVFPEELEVPEELDPVRNR